MTDGLYTQRATMCVVLDFVTCSHYWILFRPNRCFLFVTFCITIIGDNQKHDQSQRQEADREDTDVIFTKDYWVFWTDFVYYSSDYHNKADEHKQDIWLGLELRQWGMLISIFCDEIDNSQS